MSKGTPNADDPSITSQKDKAEEYEIDSCTKKLLSFCWLKLMVFSALPQDQVAVMQCPSHILIHVLNQTTDILQCKVST